MIPARILKEFATDISPVLTVIFQQSLDTGELPSDWLMGSIVPLLKKKWLKVLQAITGQFQ